MKYRRVGIYLVSIAVIVILFGCAAKQAYEGKKLPLEKVALIRGSIGVFSASTSIISLDGKEDMRWTSGEVEALPGYHEMEVLLQYGLYVVSFRRVKVSFIAKAGHVYRVEGTVRQTKGWVWVVDEGDNSIVGGAKP